MQNTSTTIAESPVAKRPRLRHDVRRRHARSHAGRVHGALFAARDLACRSSPPTGWGAGFVQWRRAGGRLVAHGVSIVDQRRPSPSAYWAPRSPWPSSRSTEGLRVAGRSVVDGRCIWPTESASVNAVVRRCLTARMYMYNSVNPSSTSSMSGTTMTNSIATLPRSIAISGALTRRTSNGRTRLVSRRAFHFSFCTM